MELKSNLTEQAERLRARALGLSLLEMHNK